MKQLILIATMLLTMPAVQAQDIVLKETRNGVFDNIVSTHAFSQIADQATLRINLFDDTITLEAIETVYCFTWPCPPVLVHSITLPIVSIEQGACGETVYYAMKDASIVDGALEEIKVVDNSSMYCDIYLEHLTVIEYKSTFLWPFQETFVTTIKGDALDTLYLY